MFGAMIAQPLAHTRGWRSTARRQAAIFLDGLAAHETVPLPNP
jgi:hypothetical protein